VKALADRLGYLGHYFLFYGPMSALGHARETDYDITIEGNKAGVHSPHDPSAFPLAAYWPSQWQKRAIAFAAKAYSPESWPDMQAVDKKLESALDSLGEEAVQIYLG
jgi:hypothetical protein